MPVSNTGLHLHAFTGTLVTAWVASYQCITSPQAGPLGREGSVKCTSRSTGLSAESSAPHRSAASAAG